VQRETVFGRTPVLIALAANLGIFGVKLVSAIWTGSAVLFSETLHSLADSTNSVFLLVGLRLALKPPDRKHPFGYGKETFFWSFVAAMFMLGVISVSSIWRGERQIMENAPVANIDIALTGLGISVILEAIAVSFAMRGLTRCAESQLHVCTNNPFKAFTRIQDPTLKLIFVEDFTALFGAIIALGAIFIVHETGTHAIDGYASILIGVILGVLAIYLAKQNREKLIGAAADEGTEELIVGTARSLQGIKDVLSVKTMFMGSNRIIVHIMVELDPDIRLEKLDDIMHTIEQAVKMRVPAVQECFIEPVADMDASWDEY